MTALETLLSRLEELERGAVSKPWTSDYSDEKGFVDADGALIGTTSDSEFFSSDLAHEQDLFHAKFIAESRNALPILLKIIRKQQEALKQIEELPPIHERGRRDITRAALEEVEEIARGG